MSTDTKPNRLGITPGKCSENGLNTSTVVEGFHVIGPPNRPPNAYVSSLADAELYADAHTTANATGKLPSELQAEVVRLREALRYIRDDYDCDSDAHKYGTTCRCCLAAQALGGGTSNAALARDEQEEAT